jgi:hypothetical protein
MVRLEREVLAAGEFDAMVDRIASRELDPYSAANDLLARALSGPADHLRRGFGESTAASPEADAGPSPRG